MEQDDAMRLEEAKKELYRIIEVFAEADKAEADKRERNIIHAGSPRIICDDVVVKDAKMENGMLLIHLEHVVPEEKKPKLIKIS